MSTFQKTDAEIIKEQFKHNMRHGASEKERERERWKTINYSVLLKPARVING